MTRRSHWMSLWIAPLLAGGGVALAQDPTAPDPPVRRHGPAFTPAFGWHRGDPGTMLERLGLDEAQQEKVQAIHLRTEKERIRRAADLEIAEIELQELMRAATPDRKKIHAQVEKLAGLQGEVRKVEVDRHLDVLEVLSLEQRQKMAGLRMHGPRFEMRLNGPGPSWQLEPAWRFYESGKGPPDADDEEEDQD